MANFNEEFLLWKYLNIQFILPFILVAWKILINHKYFSSKNAVAVIAHYFSLLTSYTNVSWAAQFFSRKIFLQIKLTTTQIWMKHATKKETSTKNEITHVQRWTVWFSLNDCLKFMFKEDAKSPISTVIVSTEIVEKPSPFLMDDSIHTLWISISSNCGIVATPLIVFHSIASKGKRMHACIDYKTRAYVNILLQLKRSTLYVWHIYDPSFTYIYAFLIPLT